MFLHQTKNISTNPTSNLLLLTTTTYNCLLGTDDANATDAAADAADAAAATVAADVADAAAANTEAGLS